VKSARLLAAAAAVDGGGWSSYPTVVAPTTVSRSPVSIPTRVLVLGMAHEDGTIHAGELYPVAEACGQSADQVRSCLRRLTAEGLFERDGSGRDALYRATGAGTAALGAYLERTRLAYVQDAAGRGWDRHWHLVAFAIPEQKRSSRDALRDRLRLFGGAAIQGGLYVSPHPWHKDVRATADNLGLRDAVTLFSTDDLEVGGERDPRELARKLWPIDELSAQYQKLVDDFSWVLDNLADMKERKQRLPDSDFLPMALAMAVAFADCFNRDPLLPPELLPRPWPGRAARDLVARSRRLGVTLRQSPGRPALFRLFDEAVEALP
jgi:phenylacetic acid degradation operon negative regulatory protein